MHARTLALGWLLCLCLALVCHSLPLHPLHPLHRRSKTRGHAVSLLETTVGETKHNWAYWTTRQDEPTQRFGVEIEIKHTFIPYTVKDYKGSFKFKQWAIDNGHHPIYVGVGAWSNLEIHLDQNSAHGDTSGALFEFVTKPITIAKLSALLNKMRSDIPKKMPDLKTWFTNTENFQRANTGPDANDAYTWIEERFQIRRLTGSGFFPQMTQLTTSLTISEMKNCRHAAVRSIWGHMGSPATEAAIVEWLHGQTFTGHKPKDVLVKHFAEQWDAEPPTTFPTDGIGKVKTEYGLHTLANKPAQLHTRNNKVALIIELRGGSSTNLETAIGAFMNGNEPASAITEKLDTLLGC